MRAAIEYSTREREGAEALILSLIAISGYAMEQASMQFAASLESDDWAAIRAQLVERKVDQGNV